MKSLRVGILAFHGDVSEHIEASKQAAKKIGLEISLLPARTKQDLSGLDGLIIPGGESPILQTLCQKEKMWGEIKKIKNIFGTCAGAILLAKKIYNKTRGQSPLKLMDIAIDRNAYGRQADSFERDIKTTLGKIHAIFIRAPKIKTVGQNVRVLAHSGGEILACEQKKGGSFYLACCFHPELTTTKFHEYFLKQI